MNGRHIIEWRELAVTLGNPGGLLGLYFWSAQWEGLGSEVSGLHVWGQGGW